MVTRIPRFAFEKCPWADPAVTTQIKCIGSEMCIGQDILSHDLTRRELAVPKAVRIFYISHALRAGFGTEEIIGPMTTYRRHGTVATCVPSSPALVPTHAGRHVGLRPMDVTSRAMGLAAKPSEMQLVERPAVAFGGTTGALRAK